MDGSKRNKMPYQWRPVSTPSSSRQSRSHQKDSRIDSENLQAVEGENEAGNRGKGVVGDDKNIRSVEGLRGAEKTPHRKSATSIVVTSSSGKYLSSIQACSSVIRFIDQKEGARRKKIEEELGVEIRLPSWREDSITIQGDSAESVSKAYESMLAIIDEAVNSRNIEYTHFISLPLAMHPELVRKLYEFQSSTLGISKSEGGGDKATENSNIHLLESKTYEIPELGIDSSIFINPRTFHLTLKMLKLWNKELVTSAAKVLQGVSKEINRALDGRPLSIRLKGLECMKGSFPKAEVLYAPVEGIGGQERLLDACQVIINAFVEAGLVLETDAKRELKLHATVMNVRYRKRYLKKRNPDYFDARRIADEYRYGNWGEYMIREAHLSERFAYDRNGYYHCCASIPFPKSLH